MIHCPDCGDRAGARPTSCPSSCPTTSTSPSTDRRWPCTRRGSTRCPARRAADDAVRDTDTLDTFVDSSWYFLRYLSPTTTRRPGPGRGERVDAGRPVHRRRRARDPAPALRALLHQGPARPRARLRRRALPGAAQPGPGHHGRPAMSKSLGNLVRPGEVYEEYGADTLRGTMLFASPPEDDIDWADVSPWACTSGCRASGASPSSTSTRRATTGPPTPWRRCAMRSTSASRRSQTTSRRRSTTSRSHG